MEDRVREEFAAQLSEMMSLMASVTPGGSDGFSGGFPGLSSRPSYTDEDPREIFSHIEVKGDANLLKEFMSKDAEIIAKYGSDKSVMAILYNKYKHDPFIEDLIFGIVMRAFSCDSVRSTELALGITCGEMKYTPDGKEMGCSPVQQFHCRNNYVRKYGWALPDDTAISELRRLIGDSLVLSVFSGTGYIEKRIDSRIIQTDIEGSNGVEKINSLDAIDKYPGANALFMCWPPQLSHTGGVPIAGITLRKYQKGTGAMLIYIGEKKGGSTADEMFFNLTTSCWNLRNEIIIPRWKGIYDRVFIYTRKTTCHECGSDIKYKCKKCGWAKYCSAECQKKGWKTHKLTCG